MAVARVGVATLLAAAAATVVAVPPESAGAAPGWKIVSSPNAPGLPNAELSSVACPSATSCFAVGQSVSSNYAAASLIEHSDGTSWSVMDTPDPEGAVSTTLYSVACADATDCVAVGDWRASGRPSGLVERWNGTSWSVYPFPHLTGRPTLRGVACPAPTTCFAVGSKYEAGATQSVLARWNGSSWSIVPPLDAATSSFLVALACSSVSNCMAVGGAGAQSLAEHWNGSAWSIVAAPDAAVGTLAGIACPSASQCIAVGSDGGAQIWNGATWSRIADGGAPAGPAALQDVVCAGFGDCVAVGVDEQFQTPVVEHSNGSALSIVSSPDPTPGTGRASLSGIACSGTTTCVAVGVKDDVFTSQNTLAEHLNGATWSVVASPTPAPTTDVLSAVTCLSATNCFAVGHHDRLPGDPADDASLIARWNGSRWSRMTAAPGTSGHFPRLDGVMCATATRCFAVGSQFDIDFTQSLVLQQWNGSRWSAVNAKVPQNAYLSALYGATCASATRCYAFGTYAAASGQNPLVQRWDGTKWAFMASPNANFGRVVGGSCPTRSTCFAVGYSFEDGISPNPLIYRSAGGKWSNLNVPALSVGGGARLSAVACASETSCVASGFYYVGSSQKGASRDDPTRPFAERWDGKQWRVTAGLSPKDATSSQLVGVACPSAANCVAVGDYTTGSTTKPLVERWNGTRWVFEPAAVPARARAATLSAIACPSGTSCVAVGNQIIRDAQSTFVEQHS